MRSLLVAAALLIAIPVSAAVSVKPSPDKPKAIDVSIVDEPLSVAVNALELHLEHPVQFLLSADPRVTLRAKQVKAEAALRALALGANARLTVENDRYWIRGLAEPAVTLDVKDADIRDILKSMKVQCGIRNLIVDPDVGGQGTFILNDVPCNQAFDLVFRTLGLKAEIQENSVVTVGRRR